MIFLLNNTKTAPALPTPEQLLIHHWSECFGCIYIITRRSSSQAEYIETTAYKG